MIVCNVHVNIANNDDDDYDDDDDDNDDDDNWNFDDDDDANEVIMIIFVQDNSKMVFTIYAALKYFHPNSPHINWHYHNIVSLLFLSISTSIQNLQSWTLFYRYSYDITITKTATLHLVAAEAW